MIQRKQSIYLALAFICVTLLLFFPIFNIEYSRLEETAKGTFGAYGMHFGEEGSSDFPLYVLFIVMALLTAAGILMYKDRKKQLMLCRLNLVFHVLIAFSLSVFFYLGKSMVEENLKAKGFGDISFSMDIGFFLLIASIPFLILAIRGIKQDEQLLKSIDRIR